MKSPLAIASLAALGLLLNGSVSAAEQPRVNGWYPCAFSTFHGEDNASPLKDVAKFECSEIEVPLCYDGVCDSDRKINVFVKRRLGKTATDPSVPRKAAIMIQGGPGGSSVVMEDIINYQLLDEKDDTIDFYTFDHRGTGRSEYLQCDAAAALTPGSPGGGSPSIDELPTCLQDLDFQYNGQAAAFSTTSAAMDVRMIIDTFLANHHVYIYGMSYGTYLAQRILQLKVPQVQGYIFDGVDVLTTKNDPLEGANSHWNAAMAEPARRLLEFCFDDPECPLKMKSRETALEDVLEIMAKLDAEPNECAKLLLEQVQKDVPHIKKMTPSEALRVAVYAQESKTETRANGIQYIAMTQRCSPEDLVQFKGPAQAGAEAPETPAPTAGPLDVLGGSSQLLYDVVVFSERWSQPPPTREERYKFWDATAVANDVERNALAYCIYTGSTEPACEELKDELPANRSTTFSYKRDKYYDEPITLPDYASALVFNGGLDFATPKEFGELLYSKLQGSGKGSMMAEFDYGTHCGGEGVKGSEESPCRDSIARQFILSGGDVAAIDTSCMDKLPGTVFHAVAPGEAPAEGVETPEEASDEGSSA